MYYIEISDSPNHGTPPLLIPMHEAHKHKGFMTAYAFPEKTKNWIESNWSEKYQCKGSMVGVVTSQQPVYSDRIFVDFDTNPKEDAKKLSADLEEIGVQHTVWVTGGRSYHIHIHCLPKTDWRVPLSQKEWISSWASSRGAVADLSIYHAVALYRMPGTIHEKTGLAKELVYEFKGALLDYDLVEAHTPGQAPENEEQALYSLWRLLLSKVDEGGRRFHVYKIVSHARRLGWGERKIEQHCEFWNNRGSKPLTDSELQDKIFMSLR